PTAAIFGAPDLRRDTPALVPAQWHPGVGHNDLEPVACRRYPEVARHLAWLGQYGEARMSGSGACVFASWPEAQGATAALAALPADMKGWIAQGLDVHPLRQLAV
ncbi:MAG: 4-(cytidine 5'-diphospho)-2-C-methyl-D-erythritol kinase, partial [Betaproteobacteria bacterium]|nr:4-(cytidine 5'-diphospho)-2-C-methyl-D-erythritol kinase [Betaproteobacteria bacterium]